ncbi:unnamed protein product [Ambrosiozyma monospora]|uniref:Unnamed protein product n=1 Tax=Ambrosiozyma monospora TaxID=43982 RepID=A0A9W6Z2Y0_AMBMO|nr:unnamed protein product [Ambrosiozyma monospora]
MEDHDGILDQLLTKSPDRWDIKDLPLTSCYNVQILARPCKPEARISNLFPYKAAKSRLVGCIKLYCKLCRATTHETNACPEAKECSRCFKKDHNVRQCNSKQPQYDVTRFQQRKLERLKASKERAVKRIG